MKLLIVDDSPIIIEKILELVEEVPGVDNIQSAGNYVEAEKLLQTFIPDVALLDINLPDKSGIELCQFLRNRDHDVFIVMVTNQTSDHYRKLSYTMGANKFIDKSKDFFTIPDILLARQETLKL